MPVATFRNYEDSILEFTVEPASNRYEVPHLATIGIRYESKSGASDGTHTDISSNSIAFWCDAESYEIDIAYPTAYDLLSWDVCAKLGFCGGFRDDQHVTVSKLLPKSGLVSATDFALLVLEAEGATAKTEAQRLRFQKMLEEAFVRHLGPGPVEASSLTRNLALPFESEAEVQGMA